MAILSSFSLQLVEPFLVVEALRAGYLLDVHFGAFGQFEQEVGDPGSRLWHVQPDVVVLVMRPEDLDPDAVVRYHASGGRRFAEVVDSIVERLTSCIGSIRTRGAIPVLVANFAMPAMTPLGPFDANVEESLTHGLAAANRQLVRRLASLGGATVWDFAGLVRICGTATVTDGRLWALARCPIAADHHPRLAAHLTRTVAGVVRAPAKCLVLDLDNTLWGGVIGDDGPGGIQLGDDYPGNVYKGFQRTALSLLDRGILLAVVSKNDHELVETTFRTHPEMVIRWDDLAAVRVNWRPKSENLLEIAADLNIGPDALVLFDDNPVERAEVRANAPEVRVIEVPSSPLGFSEALMDSGAFDQPVLSMEDRRRAVMYRQEHQRRTAAAAAATPEEFLRGLEMEATVGRLDHTTLARISQLIAKTNQFNLTTRRHSQAEIAAMGQDPGRVVAWLRLRDRYGDQGLVVVGILQCDGPECRIDSFLMSCRVMNRQVERAFMAYLLDGARSLGCSTVVGDYLPTARNAIVREFYGDLGFTPLAELDGGGRRFVLDLRTTTVRWPEFIRRSPPVAATRESGAEQLAGT
jgi:FkbH-like protein